MGVAQHSRRKCRRQTVRQSLAAIRQIPGRRRGPAIAGVGAICGYGPSSRHGTAPRSSEGLAVRPTGGRGSAKAPDVQPHCGRKDPSGTAPPGPHGACTSGERRQAVSGAGGRRWGDGPIGAAQQSMLECQAVVSVSWFSRAIPTGPLMQAGRVRCSLRSAARARLQPSMSWLAGRSAGSGWSRYRRASLSRRMYGTF